jgi:hypothetical protein
MSGVSCVFPLDNLTLRCALFLHGRNKTLQFNITLFCYDGTLEVG